MKHHNRWRVVFRPGERVFANGLDPAFALADLAALGPCKVTALLDALPPFAELDPEVSWLGWNVELETTRPRKDIDDIFLFMDDARELTITELGPPPTTQASGFFTMPSAVAPAPSPADATPAPAPPGPVRPPAPSAPSARAANKNEASLRVTTEKVDSLINLVGELVITQAMISRSLASFSPAELPRLREATTEMERHTRDLQQRVMNIRMVPIGTVFSRFRRLVRDLGEQLGKDIELQLQGEDTELDKSMVEALADPLTHLVRNAADHGLEPTARRLETGKARTGTLTLSARHQGGSVVIEVSDDGGGLDVQRILARGRERGLVPPNVTPSVDEVHQLIFAPGFSTAAKVTDVSGRGVGMDVVKRTVESLNGSIAIASTPGQGTRFRLTLPLTLAILDGMALRVGDSTWVIPLNQVIETLPLKQNPVTSVVGQGEVVRVRGRTTALLRPGPLLGAKPDANNPRPLAVVCEVGELRYALAVDELLGKAQYVIKSLEPNFKKLDGVLGATILGDGTVSFILDVPGLARLGRLVLGEDAEHAPDTRTQPEARP
ncbi:MAG: chemotaxis protein CheA [Myxococcaceae bacterium]